MAAEKKVSEIDPDSPAPPRGTPEYMAWMSARARRSSKTGRPRKDGRPRAAERELSLERLKNLEPEAVDLLEMQMKRAQDPEATEAHQRLGQNAAKLLLEWSRGKPTQTTKSESNVITEIRYESAAWRPPIVHSSEN